MKNVYTADFETTTNPDDCRVWAYGVCTISDNHVFMYGNDIADYFELCRHLDNPTMYFHHLEFDGTFLLDYLFRAGYEHVIVDKRLETPKEGYSKKLGEKQFTTLISDTGKMYQIEVCFSRKGKRAKLVTFKDSMKVIPSSVEKIAKDFKLPISKLKIDYKKDREPGHILTDEERDYLQADVEIMARALAIIFEQGLTKLTTGSNALFNYKTSIGEKNYDYWFPTLDHERDKDIRQAYRGGFTYADPRFIGKDIFYFNVYDVNSLYPWVMRHCLMPYGDPVFFKGKYKQNDAYPLYVQQFRAQFQIKKDKIPTVQIRNSLSFIPNQYLTSSNDEFVTLTMTNVDLQLFFDHYDVYDIEYKSGYMFKGSSTMFAEYIDFWTETKTQAKRDGNGAMYTLAKLMLNSLSGKFGSRTTVQSKIPFFSEPDNMVKYKLGEEEEKKAVYVPVAVFTTSYARNKTIRAAQENYATFMYADTDSLHLCGEAKNIEIDEFTLGAWKHELTGNRARYLAQKSYIEYGYDPTDERKKVRKKVTVAGMPKSCYYAVTWKNFHIDKRYNGKLQAKKVPGGTVLIDTQFTFKKRLTTQDS